MPVQVVPGSVMVHSVTGEPPTTVSMVTVPVGVPPAGELTWAVKTGLTP